MSAIDIVVNSNKYIIWLWRVDLKDGELFRWKKWKFISPFLSKIFETSQHQTWIFSEQRNNDTGKKLPFGKMRWSDENNKKWTEKYQNSDESSFQTRFVATFFVSPHLNLSADKNIPITIFSDLVLDDVRGSQQFFIAIQADHFKENKTEILETINNLEDEIGETHILFERLWSVRNGNSWRNPITWASIPFLQERYEEVRFLTKNELNETQRKQSLLKRIFRF